MKQLILLVAAMAIVGVSSSEVSAQRLLGRIFGSRMARPAVVQPSFSPATSPYRIPQPVTGYGANLHRNFMIRQAQQKAAATGIQPSNRGNILWAR